MRVTERQWKYIQTTDLITFLSINTVTLLKETNVLRYLINNTPISTSVLPSDYHPVPIYLSTDKLECDGIFSANNILLGDI